METYEVKRGDTLESIAKLYNIPAYEIIKANNLMMPYNLVVGQIINIPTGSFSVFDYYTVKKGDTLYNIASMYNTNVNTLSQVNGLNMNEYIYPGQTLLVPKQSVGTYITTNGDTLQTVAAYFKTNPQDILYSNNNIYLLPDQLIVYRKN